MTILDDGIEEGLLQIAVEAYQSQFLLIAKHLIQHLPVDQVLALVGRAYRSVEAGSVLAGRFRETAEEIEEAGVYLFHKNGV